MGGVRRPNLECDDRKNKGSIIMSDDRVLKQTADNMHRPDIPQIEVQQSLTRIREAASKTQKLCRFVKIKYTHNQNKVVSLPFIS